MIGWIIASFMIGFTVAVKAFGAGLERDYGKDWRYQLDKLKRKEGD